LDATPPFPERAKSGKFKWDENSNEREIEMSGKIQMTRSPKWAETYLVIKIVRKIFRISPQKSTNKNYKKNAQNFPKKIQN
jgi:hypothetical protein